MTAALTLEPSSEVQSLWTTEVIISHVDVEHWLDRDPRAEMVPENEMRILDPSILSVPLDDIEVTWRSWFQALGASVSAQIDISIELWCPGYEAPAVASSADYTGWLFLKGEPAAHSDSGNVAVLDPRTASAMSAVPGLPWGRSLVLQPLAGGLLIVPGWLTASVLPLERDQASVVMRAACVRTDQIERR